MSAEPRAARRRHRPGHVSEALRRGAIAAELADDVDGLLTEEQLRRVRSQAELSLDIRQRELELSRQARREFERCRDVDYEFGLREVIDAEVRHDDDWHRAFGRTERWDRHWPRLAGRWIGVVGRAVALAAATLAVYACGRTGVSPADAWNSLFG